MCASDIVHSEFLGLDIDVGELSRLVAGAVGRACRLTSLRVRCTYPVFRGEAADGAAAPLFVKVGQVDEWLRTRRLLQDVGACDLFAPLRVTEPLSYRGFAVFVFDWRETAVVPPEDMNEAQVESFVAGCVRLSEALQRATAFTPLAASPVAPERLYGVLAKYAAAHPIPGRALSRLLAIPSEARTLAGRRLRVVHGDFHAKNFAFAGDRFASVFDFDQLTEGLAGGDLVNALVERFASLSLPAAARRRLEAVTRRILALWPGPREDLAVSANVLRLRYAARRIEKHPDALWAPFDVLRRDRRIAGFLRILKEV